MKFLHLTGATMVLSAFLLPALAEPSAITDKAAGMATDIVEIDNIIQVYHYLGASPEATFPSTFDEGENWLNAWITPYTPPPAPPKSPPITKTSPYVETIDKCVADGNLWDYRTDTCREAR